jgi:hypothetical protein
MRIVAELSVFQWCKGRSILGFDFMRYESSGTAKPHSQRGGNVKKQNEPSGPCATAAVGDDPGDTKKRPFHEIVPDGLSIPSLDVFERKEVLPMLAQHIAQLPLPSQKLLAMYYYEDLPISRIAACFNLPTCRIYEILTQTVGSLGKDLTYFIQVKFQERPIAGIRLPPFPPAQARASTSTN